MDNVLIYLENIVEKFPSKRAFIDGATGEGITFSEFYNEARVIGSFLEEEGYYREPVLVFTRKSPRALVSYLGALYGGCFYVPLDEEMPAFRIELIIDNLKSRLMIVDKDSLEAAGKLSFSGRIVLFDDIISGYSINEDGLLRVRSDHKDTDIAYVIYTSGSTGIPKGVTVTHRNLIDYIDGLVEVLDVDENAVFGSQAPFYFDASLKDIYPVLKVGASMIIIPKQLFMFPIKLIEFLNDNKINTICFVASALSLVSALNTFKKLKPEYLKLVTFVGEVFPTKQFNRWKEALPSCRFINLYGPTECTGVSLYHEIMKDEIYVDEDIIPIGKPLKNTKIFLLDDNNEEAEEGEIIIGGSKVSSGYYLDPDRTKEAFVINPLSDDTDDIVYRTGDIARYDKNGDLVFVSRKDFQIKHMGHRVELGEIEANLSKLEGIVLTVATYSKEKDKISLYYEGSLEEKEVKTILACKLPRYMMPSKVCKLEHIPLTATGKVDRNKLSTY